MSWINLTDRLYGLFKTDKHANEVRKMDCPKMIFSDNEVVGKIWEILGYYEKEMGTVTLCETNIQATAEELSKSKESKLSKTKIYWAIEELVRLHEHAHHLFFNLQWRNYKTNGKLPFIVQSSAALTKLVAQKDIKVSLKLHKEYEKTQILRSSLNRQFRSCFEEAVIESVPQFAVYFMIRGNAELEGVFKALDDISPPEYKHWRDISDNCKDYEEDDEITVIPFVFNVVTSVLSSNGLINNLSDPVIITIEEVLESIGCLLEGS